MYLRYENTSAAYAHHLRPNFLRQGFEDAKPWHPRCCEVPMWLRSNPQLTGPRS
jgi:hypothetical protein